MRPRTAPRRELLELELLLEEELLEEVLLEDEVAGSTAGADEEADDEADEEDAGCRECQAKNFLVTGPPVSRPDRIAAGRRS